MDKKIKAKELIECAEYEKALIILSDCLDDNPNDAQALFLFGAILIKQRKLGIAYNICARAAKLQPEISAVWINYGLCQPDNEVGWDAAHWCFNKAIELDPKNAAALAQMASLMTQICDPQKAHIYAKRALKIEPGNKVALGSRAFAYLMQAKWEKGFNYYQSLLQTQFRLDIQYGDLPMWDGTPGQTVIVYGEQGIGDELLFASVLNDMATENTIIYDTMPRLKNLLQRSFKSIYVTGNRWSDKLEFPLKMVPTARIPIAGIPIYYRKVRSDFNGKAYLKPNPDMVVSVKGILSSLGNNVKIGIAWTGGAKTSRQHLRTQTLESLTTILRVPGIDFISLQYNDSSEEINEYYKNRKIKIHQFPFITEIKEYDYTAALISELDLIISVPTSAVQLAGGLGIEAWVLVPNKTGWLFMNNDYPWANSVVLHHNFKPQIIAQELQDWLLISSNLKQQKG